AMPWFVLQTPDRFARQCQKVQSVRQARTRSKSRPKSAAPVCCPQMPRGSRPESSPLPRLNLAPDIAGESFSQARVRFRFPQFGLENLKIRPLFKRPHQQGRLFVSSALLEISDDG